VAGNYEYPEFESYLDADIEPVVEDPEPAEPVYHVEPVEEEPVYTHPEPVHKPPTYFHPEDVHELIANDTPAYTPPEPVHEEPVVEPVFEFPTAIPEYKPA